jgi:hypothetical protein
LAKPDVYGASLGDMPLKTVSCGLKWLETVLNGIIKEVNTNKPLQSGTIATQQTSTGTVLTVTKPTGTGQGQSSDPSGGSWQEIQLMDNNCVVYTMNVWAQGAPQPVPGQPTTAPSP